MDFFDNLKDKAIDLAQSGVAKSRQLAEIAKLKTANMGEEDTIKKAYIEIGKLYYAERGMAPDGAYAALCEKITAAKINIEENKNRIIELKGEDDPAEDFGLENDEPEITVTAETPAEPEAPEVPETPAPETPVEPLHQDVPPEA